MERRRLVYAVVGLLALVVVAMGATTLTDPTENTGGQPGTGPGEQPPSTFDLSVGEFGFMAYLLYGAFVLLVAGAVLAMLRYPLTTLRELGRLVVAGAFVLALWATVLWLTVRSEPGDDGPPPPTGNNSTGGDQGLGSGAGENVGDAAGALLQDPSLVLLAAMGLVALGLVVAVLVGEDPGSTDSSPGAERTDQETLAAVGRAAGEAADRLDGDAAVENEVYDAWKVMTDLLDVEAPDARTPGEFRRAAVDAGMAEEDVAALTELFEAVRYGGREATDDRERRAREALRRVERTYAEGSR